MAREMTHPIPYHPLAASEQEFLNNLTVFQQTAPYPLHISYTPPSLTITDDTNASFSYSLPSFPNTFNILLRQLPGHLNHTREDFPNLTEITHHLDALNREALLNDQSLAHTIAYLADSLHESDPAVINQLRVILDRHGREYTINTLHRALDLEHNGGLLIKSGKRRRTIGGIYFHLVKSDHAPEPTRKRQMTWQEIKRRAKQLIPNNTLQLRATVTGKLTSLPQRVPDTDTWLTKITYQASQGSKPKGSPLPPSHQTTITLCLTTRQTNKLRTQFSESEPPLITVEGTPYADHEGSLILYVTTITFPSPREHSPKTK